MNRTLERQRAHREAVAEHRRREDAAPRLHEEIAQLLSLRLRFDDISGEGRLLVASYARPIVVASAPAHFEIRCMDPRCSGRHDLTYAILHALRRSEASFAGSSNCDGMIGDEPCHRVLGYAGEASYRAT